MTSGVVCCFEPVYVDIGSDELPAVSPDAIDLARDCRQSGAAAAHSCQLVGPGILTVLGGLRAIFRRNLAVQAALGAIVRRHLAVVDGSHAAVRGVSRAIPRGSGEVARRVVSRFGPPGAKPRRHVAI